MSRNLITVHQDDPAPRAFELLLTNDIRHLPVVSRRGTLVGIVTDRDLSEAIIPADPSRSSRSMYHTVKNIKTKKIMTPNPVTIGMDASIRDAAQILLERKIDCLPVKDKTGTLVGILTSTDIIQAFIEFTRILEETRRIDIVMDTGNYKNVVSLLESQGIPVVSVSITDDENGEKAVFSFRIQAADTNKVTRLLRKKGFEVIQGN